MRTAHTLAALLPLALATSLAAAVTVSLPLNPASPYAGQTVQLNTTGFDGIASGVNVTITPPSGNGSPVTFAATTVTPNLATTTAVTARKVIFTLPASLATASAIANTSISISGSVGGVAFTSNTASPFTISPAPLISNVSPGAAQAGTTATGVVIALKNTSWAAPASPSQISVGFTGPSNTFFLGTVTAFDATRQKITANIPVPANATPGSYTVCAIPSGTLTSSCPAGSPFQVGGFAVSATQALSFSSISPNVAAQCAANLPIDVVGTNTHFLNGTPVANFGDGITVKSVTPTTNTAARAIVTVDCLAPVGPRTVTFVTGGEFAQATNGFTISSSSARISQISPATGVQGQNLSVTLTGSGTNWTQSGTGVSFGPGINVGNVTVNPTAQTLAASISISPTAALGTYSVTATTNGEIASIANAFTVTVASAPKILSVTPTTGVQGASGLALAVVGFNTEFTKKLLLDFGPNISTSVAVADDTHATVTLGIAPVAYTGTRSVILSTLALGTDFATDLPFSFSVLPGAATITSVAPTSLIAGKSYQLQVQGSGTHWVQGLTTASVGGAVVNRVTISQTDATKAFVDITVPATAPFGTTGISMTTGGETATKTGLTIGGCTPTLSLNPASGMVGTSPTIGFTVDCVTFTQGTFPTIDGQGVTMASPNFPVGQSTGTATFVIGATAPTGVRTVTLTIPGSPSTVVTARFVVTNTPAVITGITPFHHAPDAVTFPVTITGANTHFDGTTTVGMGTNVTVGTPYNVTSTQLTANATIALNAQVGWRTVFVNTGTEQLQIGFYVDSSNISPALTSVVPSSAAQGQGPITVTITGSNTNFTANTIPILGQGVTVTNWTMIDNLHGTATISVDPRTPVGPRSVEMITNLGNGAIDDVSHPNLFSVTSGIAAISSVTAPGATTKLTLSQGDTGVAFAITGNAGTHFLDGATTVNFGSGITVSDLTVVDATHLTGHITASYSAPTGLRGITATTLGEIAPSFSDAVLVNLTQPSGMTLTPTSVQQGTQVSLQVQGIGTHWVNGVTTATFGNNNGLTVNSFVVNAQTQQATLNLSVDGTTYLAPPGTPYTLTVTTQMGGTIETFSLPNVLSVTPGAAVITYVSPTSGNQGTTKNVSITGQSTHFQNGVSQAVMTSGSCPAYWATLVDVNVASVVVTDATHATLSVAVSTNAPTGLRTLCVYTQGEIATYGNAFTVLPGTPTLNGVSPVSGTQGSTQTLTILGQFTHWGSSTTATFGQGITQIGNLSVATDATGNQTATVQVSIGTLAYTGPRTVTLTTGTEIVSGSFFAVTPSDAIINTLSTTTANQGAQNVLIQINGFHTHWAQGQTQFQLTGDGITVNGFQVQDATTALATVSISPTASLGTRSVYMATAGEILTKANSFLITGGIPAITCVSPSTVTQGQQGVNIGICGAYTTWTTGTTNVSIDSDLTVTPASVVNSNTSITAVVNVASNSTLGLHTLTVQTGSQVLTANINIVSVAAPPVPYISYMNPGQALVGQTLDVYFSGSNTKWQPGSSTISFGAGVTVNSFQVTGLTSAVANITVASGAGMGSRTVTIATGNTETETTSFSVTVGTPVISLIDPGSILQGQTRDFDVVGQFISFFSGTTFSACSGVTVNSVTIDGGTARVNMSASPTAPDGACTLTSTSTRGTASGQFSVVPGTAIITGLAPNTALQGNTLTGVGLTGYMTHWGATTFNFGSGITVSNVRNVTATSATVDLTLDPFAAVGTHTVTATTGGETATLNNGFVVQPGTPILLSSTPSSVQQQSNFSIGILGQFTTFQSSATTVNLGTGALNVVVTPTSETSLTVTGSIDPVAFTGARNITVTMGSRVMTLYNALTITAGPAALTSLNPAQGNLGQTLNVAVTGTNTHFTRATPTANFGSGVTVNSVSVTDDTHATVSVAVSPLAATGVNSVSMLTLGEYAVGQNIFTIVGIPTLTTANPVSAHQNDSNISVALTGTYTHFSNASTVSFGSGITVNSFSAPTQTSITANISVDPAAAVGTRNITVTSGSEVVTLTNGFTVLAGGPYITLTPNSGRRGTSNLSVAASGMYLNIGAGTTAAFSGSGISIASITPTGTNTANAVLNIAANAPLGAQALVLTTNGQAITLPNAFAVTPAILSVISSAPNGVSNVAYTLPIVTGGLAPFTFQITGTLPSGLSSNSTTGGISFTAAAPGTFSFTVHVTDASGQSANGAFTINVYDPLVISTVSLPAGLTGTAYSQTVAASGGLAPRTFSVFSGSLPANVTLDPNTGVISGNPSAAGTANFTVRVTDAASQTVDKPLSIAIYGPPVFTTTTLAAGRRTFAYNQPVNFSGGVPPLNATISAGTLPNGLNLNPTTGAIAGTPTVAGTANFTVLITDHDGHTASQALSLQVIDTLSISTTTLPNGIANVPYSQTIQTANGVAPVTFAVTAGTPPGNITLNPATGVLSGTPTTVATSNFTIQATDGLGQTASASLSINVIPQPVITSISPNSATAGKTLDVAIVGQNTHFTGGTTTVSFGAGITVNSLTITGTTALSANITIDAASAQGTRNVVITTGTEVATAAAGFTVNAAPPSITGIQPSNAAVNTTASITVTGQSLLGATFAFQTQVPNSGITAPSPITVVSNDGTTAILTFPTGSAQSQFALVATTSVASSPVTSATQFVVRTASATTISSLPSSVLNISNNWVTSQTLPAGSNVINSLSASVLNISNNWVTSQTLPAGSNVVNSLSASVLNISNNWNTSQTLPAGTNVINSLSASVLNISNNWNTSQTLPAGSNVINSLSASVLNILWNNSFTANIPSGQFNISALTVSVCNVASGCPAGTPHSISLSGQGATTQSVSAVAAKTFRTSPPRLTPVESSSPVVEGRTILLNAQGAESATSVDYEVNGVVVARTTKAPHRVQFTVPSGVTELTFQAMVTDAAGTSLSSLVRVPVLPDTGEPVELPALNAGDTATLAAHGWRTDFYSFNEPLTGMPDLADRTPVKTTFATALNQPNPRGIFGDDPLGSGFAHDFVARYSAEVWIPADGNYGFWLTARSAASLEIDGKPVVPATFTAGLPNTANAELALTAGWHKISATYALAVGAESALLEWQQPGGDREVMGPAAVRTDLPGITPATVPARFDSVWLRLQRGAVTRDLPLRIR